MNINDKVKVQPCRLPVQLTPFGADIWNKRYDGLEIPEEELPAKVLHGEFIEEKLWYIMRVFGPHMSRVWSNILDNTRGNPFVDCQMEIM